MDLNVLEKWININSGSAHSAGLERMTRALEIRLADLPGTVERIPLPGQRDLDGSSIEPRDALRLRFRPEAPLQVLLSGHLDTVYGPGHPFQKLEYLEESRARGPGIADMKGGLFIMIEALETFLAEDRTGHLGGELLITADEEIGSPLSKDLVRDAGRRHHAGLVFESALPGGELVSRRLGGGLFRILATGRAAHTGRDFEKGRNALVALSEAVLACNELNQLQPGVIVNVGRMNGGGPVNVVPESAEAWVNVRIGEAGAAPRLEAAFAEILEGVETSREGITLGCEGGFARPPKVESKADARLHEIWNATETGLGLAPSGKRATGGGSDGNLLSAAGLPLLDGVGIKGGNIHSGEEFAFLESIPEQVRKTVAFLHALAADPEAIRSLRQKPVP